MLFLRTAVLRYTSIHGILLNISIKWKFQVHLFCYCDNVVFQKQPTVVFFFSIVAMAALMILRYLIPVSNLTSADIHHQIIAQWSWVWDWLVWCYVPNLVGICNFEEYMSRCLYVAENLIIKNASVFLDNVKFDRYNIQVIKMIKVPIIIYMYIVM